VQVIRATLTGAGNTSFSSSEQPTRKIGINATTKAVRVTAQWFPSGIIREHWRRRHSSAWQTLGMAEGRSAEHENGLAKFVLPDHRPRFRESLQDERLRKRLRAKLAHFNYLDARFSKRLTSGNRNVESILTELRRRGAPTTCYVMSENDDVDARTMDLEEALRAVFSEGWGTFLSCIPGKLAYFEDEHGERHILEQPEVGGHS
jgi:hypothetical protein